MTLCHHFLAVRQCTVDSQGRLQFLVQIFSKHVPTEFSYDVRLNFICCRLLSSGTKVEASGQFHALAVLHGGRATDVIQCTVG
jgi:hypothetical protein